MQDLRFSFCCLSSIFRSNVFRSLFLKLQSLYNILKKGKGKQFISRKLLFLVVSQAPERRYSSRTFRYGYLVTT